MKKHRDTMPIKLTRLDIAIQINAFARHAALSQMQAFDVFIRHSQLDWENHHTIPHQYDPICMYRTGRVLSADNLFDPTHNMNKITAAINKHNEALED